MVGEHYRGANRRADYLAASCAYQYSAREEASGRFGGATCKVVVSEPCRETRGRLAQNLRRLTAALETVGPRISELADGRPQNHGGDVAAL